VSLSVCSPVCKKSAKSGCVGKHFWFCRTHKDKTYIKGRRCVSCVNAEEAEERERKAAEAQRKAAEAAAARKAAEAAEKAK
jgi:hypothetical protein